MYYRIGFPFWKIMARLGFVLSYRYDIYYSRESDDYCAYSPDIKGLFAESKDLNEVVSAMQEGAKELVSIDLGRNVDHLCPTGIISKALPVWMVITR